MKKIKLWLCQDDQGKLFLSLYQPPVFSIYYTPQEVELKLTGKLAKRIYDKKPKHSEGRDG